MVQDEDSSSASVSSFCIEEIYSTSSGLIKIINSEGLSFSSRLEYFDEGEFDALNAGCGKILDEDLVSVLLSAVRKYLAELVALGYLNRAEHSRFQLKTKLKKRGYFDEEIKSALDYLEAKGFLSDQRFAGAWLRARSLSKKEGRFRLTSELLSRGLEVELVKATVDDFFSEHSEKEICRVALKKQLAKGLDYRRLMRSMQRLGFSINLVNICLEEEEKEKGLT